MAIAVTTAPRLTAPDAVRLAAELYGVTGIAEALPSERDQNFLLRTEGGERFVLKIANSAERREVLEYQNAVIERVAAGCPGLRFPRAIGGIAQSGAHLVRLFTWIEGEVLAKVAPHSDELLGSLGRAMGEIVLALDGFTHPAATRTLHWDVRHADLARVHLDLLPAKRRRIVEAGFEDRVMYGTDQLLWPNLMAQSVNIIDTADYLTPEQKRDILYNNAARFLRLDQ